MINNIIKSINERRVGKIERQLALLKEQVEKCLKEQEIINETSRILVDEFITLNESNEKTSNDKLVDESDKKTSNDKLLDELSVRSDAKESILKSIEEMHLLFQAYGIKNE